MNIVKNPAWSRPLSTNVRKYSHNESEFCLSVNPQDWPVFFLPDDRKRDESARTYTGGSSYTGPAVSYAAAGV